MNDGMCIVHRKITNKSYYKLLRLLSTVMVLGTWVQPVSYSILVKSSNQIMYFVTTKRRWNLFNSIIILYKKKRVWVNAFYSLSDRN